MPATPLGRPSKLTPEVQETICKYLRAGNAFKTACEAAGIGYATGKQWRQRGEDRHPDRKSGEDYVAFVAAVERAEAEALARCAAVVQKAAVDGSVQAATWFLERRAPAEWGRAFRWLSAHGKADHSRIGLPFTCCQFFRQLIVRPGAESYSGRGLVKKLGQNTFNEP